MFNIYLQNQFNLVYKRLLEMPDSRNAQINKYNTLDLCGVFGSAKETNLHLMSVQRVVAVSTHISSVQFSHSVVSNCVTTWTAALQASLSITNSWSLLKLMSIESVMPSNHLILCHPLLLLPSIFPSIRVFSNESTLCIRWPEYWSFSFSISPSNEYSGLISFRMDWLDPLQSQGLSRVFNTAVQKHQFFGTQFSL